MTPDQIDPSAAAPGRRWMSSLTACSGMSNAQRKPSGANNDWGLPTHRRIAIYFQGMESPLPAARLMTPTADDRGGVICMNPPRRWVFCCLGFIGRRRRRCKYRVCASLASEPRQHAARAAVGRPQRSPRRRSKVRWYERHNPTRSLAQNAILSAAPRARPARSSNRAASPPRTRSDCLTRRGA